MNNTPTPQANNQTPNNNNNNQQPPQPPKQNAAPIDPDQIDPLKIFSKPAKNPKPKVKPPLGQS